MSKDVREKWGKLCISYQGMTNRFSNDLPDLAFHLSVIKLCSTKPLAPPMKALSQGVGQWDLSAPAYIPSLKRGITPLEELTQNNDTQT